MIETISKIREAWKDASEQIRDDPEEFKKEYPDLSPEQLDEAIETFCKWAERQAPPHGFKPISGLARTLLATETGKLLRSIEAYNISKDWEFPFLEPLGRGLAFVSLSAVFSDKDESRKIIAAQGGKLAENLALLDTAQGELSRKMDSLNQADALVAKLTEHESGIAARKVKVDEICTSIEQIRTQVEENDDTIEAAKAETEAFKKQVKVVLEQSNELLEQNRTMQASLAKQSEQLDQLKIKTTEQSKLITDLLPGATSAGLAAAYGDRARSLIPNIKYWRLLFIISIVALVAGSVTIVTLTLGQDADIWKYFFLRLPMVIPVVWIAWFSAIQYGNSTRLEEHYSFKEATSKAFAGYREHIEHLGGLTPGVDGDSKQDIVKRLAESTVTILGKPPSDIFNHTDAEASPVSQVLAIIVGRLFGGGTASKKVEEKK